MTFHGIAEQSACHSNICWKDKHLSLHWEVWVIGKSLSVRILWISSTSLHVFPSSLLESSSESECESDEDSTCSSSSDSEVFDVIAEIKRKKAHPDRLHDELWYNDPGQVRMCFMFLLGRVQAHTSHLWPQVQKMHVGWYWNWIFLWALWAILQSSFPPASEFGSKA